MLLLTFTAGANRYAIDVARVVELVPRVELRPVPHAPAFLAGLLGYRGKVVPVIDLGLLLDAAPCRIASALASSWSTTRPAITIVGSRIETNRSSDTGIPSRTGARSNLLGLIGEQVSDLINVQPEQVMPARRSACLRRLTWTRSSRPIRGSSS